MEDLGWAAGQANMGGLVGNVYAVAIDDVDPALTGLSMNADGVTVEGNIALLTDKKFGIIYHTPDTGKLEDPTVGEKDGKSFENMVEIFHPGQSKAKAKFKADYVNTPLLVIVKDTDGNQRILGLSLVGGSLSLDLPAHIESIAGTSGAARADRRGDTFQIKSNSAHPPLFYSGTIDVTSPDA